MINELSIKGAKVIFQDTHVSGHACQEELKIIYTLLKPMYSIPIHGEYRHRSAQKEIAVSLGMDKDKVIMLKSGDVLELSKEKAVISTHVAAKQRLVDGLGVGDIGNAVLRDRQYLSENGLVVVSMAVFEGSDVLANGPELLTKGFVYVKESETLLEEAKFVANEAFEYSMAHGYTDMNRVKNEIKQALADFFWKSMKRRPMILAVILTV